MNILSVLIILSAIVFWGWFLRSLLAEEGVG
jgi:hypothetical protein